MKRKPKPVAFDPLVDPAPDGGHASGLVRALCFQPGPLLHVSDRRMPLCGVMVALEGDDGIDRWLSPHGLFAAGEPVTAPGLVTWLASRTRRVRAVLYLRGGVKVYHRAEFTETDDAEVEGVET